MNESRVNEDPDLRSVVINGLPQRVRYDTHALDRVLIPGLDRWVEATADTSRSWALLAAPPGTGKSVLAHLLAQHFGPRMQCLGIDGFHFPQRYLDAVTFRDDAGTDRPLAEVKGAPRTFDTAELLRRIRNSRRRAVRWPTYDRQRHDVVDGADVVRAGHILLEGNWLLLADPAWTAIRREASFTVFIDAPEPVLRERLIARKVQGGLTRAAAECFYAVSDGPNVRRCLTGSDLDHVDLVLEMAADGSLHERQRE